MSTDRLDYSRTLAHRAADIETTDEPPVPRRALAELTRGRLMAEGVLIPTPGTHAHECPKCGQPFRHRDSWDCRAGTPSTSLLCIGCWLAGRRE